MTAAMLVSGLGGLCVAGALVYGATLVAGSPVVAEPLHRVRLALHRAAVRRRLPGWVPRGWVEPQPDADPMAIGRHAAITEGYDEAHCARIADICRRLAERCGLSPAVAESLVEAAHLHDAGVEGWDVDLRRTGSLAGLDRDRLAEHCARGENLAREISPDPMVASWVRWHHERFDGSGYPDALETDEIPLGAQILGLADTYEAMTHARPHRPALEPQDAVAELQRLAGLQFDPTLVGDFVQEVYPALVQLAGHRPGQA